MQVTEGTPDGVVLRPVTAVISRVMPAGASEGYVNLLVRIQAVKGIRRKRG